MYPLIVAFDGAEYRDTMPLPRVLLGEPWALRLHRHDSGIPYGLALAAGALLVYPHTVWFSILAG